jgi:hypothetical protein
MDRHEHTKKNNKSESIRKLNNTRSHSWYFFARVLHRVDSDWLLSLRTITSIDFRLSLKFLFMKTKQRQCPMLTEWSIENSSVNNHFHEEKSIGCTRTDLFVVVVGRRSIYFRQVKRHVYRQQLSNRTVEEFADIQRYFHATRTIHRIDSIPMMVVIINNMCLSNDHRLLLCRSFYFRQTTRTTNNDNRTSLPANDGECSSRIFADLFMFVRVFIGIFVFVFIELSSCLNGLFYDLAGEFRVRAMTCCLRRIDEFLGTFDSFCQV